jgi:hypothetical protein
MLLESLSDKKIVTSLAQNKQKLEKRQAMAVYYFGGQFTTKINRWPQLLKQSGLPDFDTIYQNGEKYTKLPQHYQMAIKYNKWP